MKRIPNQQYNMISNPERGGALILVFISIIILSVTGISMFQQSQTEFALATNYFNDKVGLMLADSGVNFGINKLRGEINPLSVYLDSENVDTSLPSSITVDSDTRFESVIKTGTIAQTKTEYKTVTGLQNIKAPWPPGLDISSTSGLNLMPYDLTVSARIGKPGSTNYKAIKEIQNGVIIPMPGY